VSEIHRCPFCDKTVRSCGIEGELVHHPTYTGQRCALDGFTGSLEDWNRRPAAPDDGKGQPKASSECPVCGVDTPHGHDREQISEWVNGRLAAWGWKAHVYNDSTDKPYGWYYAPHHVAFVDRFTLSKPDDMYGYVPLYFHPAAPQGWQQSPTWLDAAAREICEAYDRAAESDDGGEWLNPADVKAILSRHAGGKS
jgi:hypothetical protein